MNTPGKYIAAGVFIGLLMFKPSFGIALGRSIGELSTAAFENNQPQMQQVVQTPQVPEPPLANRPDYSEEREAVFGTLSMIVERLEALEMFMRKKDAEPEVELPRFSEKEQPSEELKNMPDRERTNSSDLIDPHRFDREFDRKFNVSRW